MVYDPRKLGYNYYDLRLKIKNYHHSFILPRLSVLVELALSSKLGTANFNDIHNLFNETHIFFFAYLPTLSQRSICPRNMKLELFRAHTPRALQPL